MLIKRQEAFRTGTDDSQVHRVTTGLARIILGCRDKPPAQTHALPRGIDGQQPQVTSRSAHLEVHATGQARRVFPQQECSSIQEFADTWRIDAVAVESNPLDDKSSVDEPGNRIDIGDLRDPRAKVAVRLKRVCRGMHS